VIHDPHADWERFQNLLEQVERRWTRRAVRQRLMLSHPVPLMECNEKGKGTAGNVLETS
jgi:hypothetical protein